VRALKINGRAASRNGKAQKTCSPCCNQPAPGDFYYQACPCIAYPGIAPCAVGDTPCIYIDAQSVLPDSAAPLAQREGESDVFARFDASTGSWTYYTIIRFNGICYSLGSSAHFTDDGLSAYQLPPGAIIVGGSGIMLDWRENCVDGCGAVNVGPEYFEAFPCDGCTSEESNYRVFVCASASVGMYVLSDGRCIDRSIGYTAAEVNTIVAAEGADVRNTPIPLKTWQNVGGYPKLLPAASCCFAPSTLGCGSSCGDECMRGVDFQQFAGDNHWFPIDVCCGKRSGLRYQVDLGWSKTIYYENGDIEREVASVLDTNPRECGGLSVTVLTHREYPNGTSEDSTNTINLDPYCCLPFSGIVPNDRTIEFAPSDGDPVAGQPGAVYSRVNKWTSGDAADQRREGWTHTPWSFLTLAFRDDPVTGTYTSTGNVFGDCNVWTFQHAESFEYFTGRRTDVIVSLRIQVLTDNGDPCSFTGGCGSSGWTDPIDTLLP